MTSSPAVIPLTRPVTTPRRFGNYVLIRKLAEGGMAEIYLAKQLGAEGFERDVVIKCMLDHFTQYPEFVSMFLDEARLAARLHHPNIVQITDLGVADNRYYICMEYLAGDDLDAVIAASHYKREGVPIPIAARIMLSTLEGLEFAHGYQEQGQPLGLVHRDISPSNIFVTYQGTVKVLDFGIAKASSRMTQTQPGLLKGKWGYMSPEQARGEQTDARSDLFSLGVTFHELLTARRVFERDNEIGVLLALMAQPIPPPSHTRPEVPPALDRIVMKALERRPEDRYASAEEMRADLEEFLRVTPSVPGVSQLAQYMQVLFGQEDVERKTKIPSLTELEAITSQPSPPSVEDPVGFEKTLVRPSAPHGLPAVVTAVSRPPPTPAAPPPPARSAGLSMAIGALAAVALVALGGVAAWYFVPRADPATVIVTPPAPAAPVAAQPPPMATPTPPVTPVPPVAEQPTPPPPEQLAEVKSPLPVPPKPVRTTPLNAEGVGLVMRKHQGKLLTCIKAHRAELPPNPRVMLVLTIANTGKVTDTQVTEPGSVPAGLAQCLKSTMSKVAFPRDPNRPEFKIQLPLVVNSPSTPK
jgi:serine/threonine protein kinase